METKSLSRQRDFSYYINPYTNLKANETSGPLVINGATKSLSMMKTVRNTWKGCPGSVVSPSGSANRG